MSVEYGVSPFAPVITALYTCECGRRTVKHGSSCGHVPRGWKTGQGRAHLCEACARAPGARPDRRQPRVSPVD